MMPRLDGFAVCREVRARAASLTILMLTAKGLVDDRVAGLDAGADDYLVKPFSTRELLARVRALLRRNQRCAATVERLRLGGAEIDFVRQQCERAGKRIALTAKEFAMLKLFAEEPSVPISRERFLEIVWGYHAFPTLRTVDNQILSLRAKLEPDPAHPIYITTVHGVGYRLEMTRP
jgi:DNA-binding response OmpR family regulator